jgi:hypothetical protein
MLRLRAECGKSARSVRRGEGWKPANGSVREAFPEETGSTRRLDLRSMAQFLDPTSRYTLYVEVPFASGTFWRYGRQLFQNRFEIGRGADIMNAGSNKMLRKWGPDSCAARAILYFQEQPIYG